MIRSESVVKRLQSVAPGADEWIIPRCPSLMDPTKGGYLDLEFMTTRSLNLTQLREIIEEFMKWPFRPSKGRLLQSAGSADLHEEAVMDDDALWAA